MVSWVRPALGILLGGGYVVSSEGYEPHRRHGRHDLVEALTRRQAHEARNSRYPTDMDTAVRAPP